MLRKYAQAWIVGVSTCSPEKCAHCSECRMASFRDAIHSGDAARNFVRLAARIKPLQKFDPDYCYIRVRAIGCAEVDGPNQNADFFPYSEFVDPRPGFGYKSFEGKNVFVEHQSSDVRNSIGFIVASYLNAFKHPPKYAERDWRDLDSSARMEILHMAGQADGSVELLNAIDRAREPVIVRKIEKGEPVATSMGCLLPDTPVTLEDGTCKPICEIVEGDRVLTHCGAVEPVAFTMAHQHDGVIYEIHTYGEAGTIRITSEHPVWIRREAVRVVRGQHATNGNSACRCGRVFDQHRSLAAHLREAKRHGWEGHTPTAEFFEGWVEAKDVQVGDFVLTPAYTTQTPSDASFARLLGYYLAKGNLGYDKKHYPDGRPVFVEWTTYAKERTCRDEITAALKKLGLSVAGPYTYSQSSNAVTIRCNDHAFAKKMLDYGGQYPWAKRVKAEVLRWAPEHQRILLEAYLNGDGCFYAKDHVEVTTASENLAHQLHLIAIRCGVRTTPPVRCHAPSTWEADNRPRYSLRAVWGCEPHATARAQAYVDEKGLWRRVSSIVLREYHGTVYNFDVGGDDSYVAADIAVHNCNVEYSTCSVCGNRASTEHQYCPHIRYSKGGICLVSANQIRDLVKSGSLRLEWLPWVLHREADRDEVMSGASSRLVTASVFEINYGLQFFEDSIVANPAYGRAWMLEKVAHKERPFAEVPTEILQQLYRSLR